MKAKNVVDLPKFGLFGPNKSDKEQVDKMTRAGYKIMQETWEK